MAHMRYLTVPDNPMTRGGLKATESVREQLGKAQTHLRGVEDAALALRAHVAAVRALIAALRQRGEHGHAEAIATRLEGLLVAGA